MENSFARVKIGPTSIFSYKPKSFLKTCPHLFTTDCSYKLLFSLCMLDLKGAISVSDAQEMANVLTALKSIPFIVINKYTHFKVSVSPKEILKGRIDYNI